MQSREFTRSLGSSWTAVNGLTTVERSTPPEMASLPLSTVRRERFTAPDPSQMPSVHLALTSALAFIPVNARSEAKTSQGWLFTSRPGWQPLPRRTNFLCRAQSRTSSWVRALNSQNVATSTEGSPWDVETICPEALTSSHNFGLVGH